MNDWLFCSILVLYWAHSNFYTLLWLVSATKHLISWQIHPILGDLSVWAKVNRAALSLGFGLYEKSALVWALKGHWVHLCTLTLHSYMMSGLNLTLNVRHVFFSRPPISESSQEASLLSVCQSTPLVCFIIFFGGGSDEVRCCSAVCVLTLNTLTSSSVVSAASQISERASCQQSYLARVIQERWHQLGKTQREHGSTSIFISSAYKWDWVLGSHLLMNFSLSRALGRHHSS